MKRFSLDKYLANTEQKIITRDGRPVRIICTDIDCELGPIIGTIKNSEGKDDVLIFTKDGKGGDSFPWLDLFFAPSTPIKHDGWINLFKKDYGIVKGGIVYNSEAEAKKIAAGDEDYVTTIKIEWEE